MVVQEALLLTVLLVFIVFRTEVSACNSAATHAAAATAPPHSTNAQGEGDGGPHTV